MTAVATDDLVWCKREGIRKATRVLGTFLVKEDFIKPKLNEANTKFYPPLSAPALLRTMSSNCSPNNTTYSSRISPSNFALEEHHEDGTFFKTDMSNTSLTELLRHPLRRQTSTGSDLSVPATTPLQRVTDIVSLALELLEDEDDF